MSYKHLTLDERYQIHAYKKTGISPSKIAIELGRDKSTISRELKRNTGARGYRPKQAHEMAVTRFKNAEKAIKLTVPVVGYIAEKITLEWSPEQVAGRLFKDENISISHETIYQYLLKDKQLGGFLYEHLRCLKKSP